MKLNVVILAAGEGKRMQSNLPKTLQCIAGKPLLSYVVEIAASFNPEEIYVVYGHHGEALKQQLNYLPVTWVEQEEQLGTGHAVMQVLPFLSDDAQVLILCGDVPFLTKETLQELTANSNGEEIRWLTAKVKNPAGLGRILRDEKGNPESIVEEKDATKEQKTISEINSGVCLVPVKFLKKWLPTVQDDNTQKEYYLTDIFSIALKNNIIVRAILAKSELEVFGVNDKIQLAYLERIMQNKQVSQYMQQGLTVLDPNRFDVRGEFIFGKDVKVDINVIIEGNVKVGSNCYIGPNVLLRNVELGDNVNIQANCVIEESVIADDCVIGPFARIRPETELASGVKIGNFVEIKKSKINMGSKVNHLSYIGDAQVGEDVNIGAGTITCNYDGANKYKTVIEDNVFIGSNAQLIAPVTIGKGATIGAGSTITENAPKGKLTLARSRQVTKDNWERPIKKTNKRLFK